MYSLFKCAVAGHIPWERDPVGVLWGRSFSEGSIRMQTSGGDLGRGVSHWGNVGFNAVKTQNSADPTGSSGAGWPAELSPSTDRAGFYIPGWSGHWVWQGASQGRSSAVRCQPPALSAAGKMRGSVLKWEVLGGTPVSTTYSSMVLRASVQKPAILTRPTNN